MTLTPSSSALLTTALQQQLAVKEEESAEEKPIFSMSYKRRHAGGGGPGSSSSSSGASTSHSAPADSTLHPEERKRILHLNAEKNRRSALKEGFETLVDAIPLVEQAGVKCTNAVVLNRAAQHIRDLKTDQEQQQRQIKSFRDKITGMNERIALIQSNLPSSSTSGSKAGETSSPSMRIQMEQFFDRYKRDRSREDYRFWLMGEVLKPIVHSLAEQIHPDASDRERVMLSARKWLDTHWNSAVLRPIASDTLVRLATASGAFTSEKALSNYVAQQVSQQQETSAGAKSSSQQQQQQRQ